MGTLVVPLRDGMSNAPGAQPGPVGPAAVGLVGDQVVGPHPRRPIPPGRATLTASTNPNSAVVSAVWPGVARVTSGRPRPSPTTWILVDRPPRERPNPCWAAEAAGASPPCGRRRHAGGRGPHWYRPAPASPAPAGVGIALHQLLDARPSPVDLPAGKPLVAGLPWPITLGEVPPGRIGPGPPDDAVDHLAVVTSAATPLASWRQQRPQPLPLRVREICSSHGPPLSHQRAIRETRPSRPRRPSRLRRAG